MKLKLATTKEQLKASNEALELQNSDPKLKDQDREIAELNDKIQNLEKDRADHISLLNEAGVDFLAKKEEAENLERMVAALKVSQF